MSWRIVWPIRSPTRPLRECSLTAVSDVGEFTQLLSRRADGTGMFGVIAAQLGLPQLILASATKDFSVSRIHVLGSADRYIAPAPTSTLVINSEGAPVIAPSVLGNPDVSPEYSVGVIAAGAALGISIPSFLERMTSLYLLAATGELSFARQQQFQAERTVIQIEYDGLVYCYRLCELPPFARAMELIAGTIPHLDLRRMRSRDNTSPIPSLLLQISDQLWRYAPGKIDRIKQRLLSH